MNSKLLFTAAAVALASFAGCTFVFEEDTTVVAQNDLTDLSVEVNGNTADVSGVNLKDVDIGSDVSFDVINAGTVTEAVTTEESGDVDISIGSATALVETALGTAPFTFTDIDLMSTTIDDGEENTVIFDETTAGVVFSALAKKLAE